VGKVHMREREVVVEDNDDEKLKMAILCIFSVKFIFSAVCCDFFERLDDDCPVF